MTSAPAIARTSTQWGRPYLTAAEYKQAPTAVDVTDLVGGGSQAIQDNALTYVIRRASSWMDQLCHQVLGATLDTETMRVRANSKGELIIHPRYWPIVMVTQILVGPNPATQTELDLAQIWIEQEQIVASPYAPFNTSEGPLQFAGWRGSGEQFVAVTYVNGYGNASLTASVAAGATSLPVDELCGFIPGQHVTVYGEDFTDTLIVSSAFVPAQGAGNLTLSAATTRVSYAAALPVTVLPPVIKQAAINMTSGLILSRGNASLVMETLQGPSRIQAENPAAQGVFDAAMSMLGDFKRIR